MNAGVKQAIRSPRAFVAEKFIRPAQQFVSTEALGGIALLAATMVALLWANSRWDASYFDLWAAHIDISSARISLHLSLHDVVNDGLMTVFFFVVGLEIKRELLLGELASLRKATLPVAAALGGMIVPALIYTAWNAGGEGAEGWGIPMATDIAFAVGVLALLGRRVPFSLKVFLLALAIVDDLGAIVVIAVFYTDTLSPEAIAWAIALIGAVIVAQRAGIRSVCFYVVLGILLWLAVFKSGIHATIAGVILAALTPARSHFGSAEFDANSHDLQLRYRANLAADDREGASAALQEFERLARDSQPPLDRLEHLLHPWTSFLIVPIFALANAGIALDADLIRESASSAITLGIMMGLIVGKPAGIFLFAWLAVRTGLAVLPENVSFSHILGVGLLGGIGFTVSLFITGLAFTSGEFVDEAKIGILTGSLIAGVAGVLYLLRMPGEPGAAPADAPALVTPLSPSHDR